MDTREIVSFSRAIGSQQFYLRAINAQHQQGNYHPSHILSALLKEYIRISHTSRQRNYLMSSYTFRYTCAAKKLLSVLMQDPECQTNGFMAVLHAHDNDIGDFRDHLFRLVSTFMSVYEEYRFYLTDNLRSSLAVSDLWQTKLKTSEVELYQLMGKITACNAISDKFVEYGHSVLKHYFSQLSPCELEHKTNAIFSLVRKKGKKSDNQRWLEYGLLVDVNPYVTDDIRRTVYRDVYDDFHVTGKVGAMNILMNKAAIIGKVVASNELDQFILAIISGEVAKLPLVVLKVLDQLENKISMKLRPQVLRYLRDQIETGELHTKLLAIRMLIRWKVVSDIEKQQFKAQLLGMIDHALVDIQAQALAGLVEMHEDISVAKKLSVYRKIMQKLDYLYNEESCDVLLKTKKIIPIEVCEEKFKSLLDKLRFPHLLAGKSCAYIYRLFTKLADLVPAHLHVEVVEYMVSVMDDQHYGADACFIIARLKCGMPEDMQANMAQCLLKHFLTITAPSAKHYRAINEFITFYSSAEIDTISVKAWDFVRDIHLLDNSTKATTIGHYEQLTACCMLLQYQFKHASRDEQIAIMLKFLLRQQINAYEHLVFVDFYNIYKENVNKRLVQKVADHRVGYFPSDPMNEIMSFYSKLA